MPRSARRSRFHSRPSSGGSGRRARTCRARSTPPASRRARRSPSRRRAERSAHPASSSSDDASRAGRRESCAVETAIEEAHMWWVFGGVAAVLWIALIVTLGVSTLRNGHIVLFILGLFFPLL